MVLEDFGKIEKFKIHIEENYELKSKRASKELKAHFTNKYQLFFKRSLIEFLYRSAISWPKFLIIFYQNIAVIFDINLFG